MSWARATHYRLTEEVMFEQKSLNHVCRDEVRPLGILSDFVVERLPHVLEELSAISDREEYLQAICDWTDSIEDLSATVLHGEGWQAIENNPEQVAVASLDLQVLWSATAHLSNHRSLSQTDKTWWVEESVARTSNLQKLAILRQASTGQPNILTYQDIIRSNPGDDIRTFTTGNLGHTEACFYRLHAWIEENLEEVVGHLDQVLRFASLSDTTGFVRQRRRWLMTTARQTFLRCVAHMGRFMAMNAQDFHTFRSYLGGHHGLQGASGLFSDGFACLDLVVFGPMLPDEHLCKLRSHLGSGYYGRRGSAVSKALQVAGQGESIVDAALSCKDEEFVGEVLALVETILAFRARHYQSVAKKLPEVAKDKAPGTGIQTGSGHFLRSRIATVRRAKDELERKLGDQDSQWSARRIAR